MDHESEISSDQLTRISYRVDVAVVASRCRVLDDVPSWINGNSERDGEARCRRDGGTSHLI
jgi:hypothetical protein